MKIENFKKAAPYRLIFPLLIISFVVSLVFYFSNPVDYNIILLIIGIVLIFIYIFFFFKKPYYFSFETKYKSFVIRFFNPHPFLSKFKAYEIQLDEFDKYEIKDSFKGFNKNLILHIKKGKKSGTYPPVSLSLLSKNQIEELKKEFNTLLKIKSLK